MTEPQARILLVDDEEGIRKVLRIALEDAGYEVLTAGNGVEALRIFEKKSPQIVLTDIKMPEMDGMQVLEAAREAGVNLKRVIISSSHPADRLHEEFDSSGCLAVIEKAEPEQQAAFLMILDSIMRR